MAKKIYKTHIGEDQVAWEMNKAVPLTTTITEDMVHKYGSDSEKEFFAAQVNDAITVLCKAYYKGIFEIDVHLWASKSIAQTKKTKPKK